MAVEKYDVQVEHISKNSFFGYLGVLVTIFLAVNIGVITFISSQVTNVETRANSRFATVENRIEKAEAERDQLASVMTDIRLSLIAIEVKLGIDEKEKYRIYLQELEQPESKSGDTRPQALNFSYEQ